jgi:hypothetical protein
MASRPVTGGASRPSLSGLLALLAAFAIGSAPIVALLAS